MLALLTGFAALPAPAAAKKPPSERMIDRINKARAHHGLRALREAPKLARTSHRFARHLMHTDSFGHGYAHMRAGFRRAGEILAFTNGWRRRPHPALGMWLHSSGHRALLLSSGFRYVGASPARGYFNGAKATIWVVHFGAH